LERLAAPDNAALCGPDYWGTFTRAAREGTSGDLSRAEVSVCASASLSVPIDLLSSVDAINYLQLVSYDENGCLSREILASQKQALDKKYQSAHRKMVLKISL
jgi:hypothetical protein